MKVLIGVDTGGTFTDFVAHYEDGSSRTLKLLSTPDDPSRAVLEGIAILAGEQAADVTYGSTVATNALLERRGARTAFITNEGFEDLLLLGRQARPALYQLRVEEREPVIPRALSFGVSGRMEPDGAVQAPLSREDLEALPTKLREAKVESVAVCLLHSYANPSHEEEILEKLSSLQIPISLSSKILPEYREYERAVTTAVNAYVAPKMEGHLRRLVQGATTPDEVVSLSKAGGSPGVSSDGSPGQATSTDVAFVNRRPRSVARGLPEATLGGLRVMQSNGGAVRAEVTAREPVRTVLSGPAGGVVGAYFAAKRAGLAEVLTFDMGGTSTDVALCDGQIRTTSEGKVAGIPIKVSLVDVHTVGAGGGSIARIDPGGALKVGPESASAVPGPACYNRGGPPTVTDANVVLGRIDTSLPLGGTLPVVRERSFEAIEKLASAMGKSVYEAAEGIVRVANAAMEKALRVISVERGFDPRGFALLSFGGAGGLHACALAEALSMSTVMIPPQAGVLSALGMLEADIVRDAARTFFASSQISSEALQRGFLPLEEGLLQELLEEGFARESIEVSRSIDLRYRGQSFEISIEYKGPETRVQEAFEAEYKRRYGYLLSARAVEIVALRVKMRVPREPLSLSEAVSQKTSARPAPREKRQAIEGGRACEVGLYERASLGVGAVVQGPAMIVEPISTTWLASGWSLEVHPSLALLLRRS